MIDDTVIENLFKAVYAVIESDGPWQDRRSQIILHCVDNESDKVWFEEFLAWFNGSMEDDEEDE